MPGLVDVFFDEYSLVTKRRTGFTRGSLESLTTLIVVASQSHSFAAATGTRLEHYRVTNLIGNLDCVLGIANHIDATGNRIHTGLPRDDLRSNLVPHFAHGFRRRADEYDTGFSQAFCKFRFFGKKSVTRMNCLRTGYPASINDLV